MSFSENIKLLRKKNGLTQKELADNCGLSIATIQGYEQGKYEPKPEALLKLVKALNTTGSELMGYSLELIKPKNNLAEIAKHTVSIDESNPAYKAVTLLIKEKQELYKATSKYQEIEKAVRAEESIIAILTDIYGKVEDKSIEGRYGSGHYYLVGNGTKQFILYDGDIDALYESTKASIPALVERMKDNRSEKEAIQEYLKFLDVPIEAEYHKDTEGNDQQL